MYNNKRKYDSAQGGSYYPSGGAPRYPSSSAYAPPRDHRDYYGGGGGYSGGGYRDSRDAYYAPRDYPRSSSSYAPRSSSSGRSSFPPRQDSYHSSSSSSRSYSNRTSTTLDEKDPEVAAAIELFKTALDEAQASLPAPTPVESAEGTEPSAPAPVEQAKLDINALTNTYREKTNNLFKKTFNRTIKEFFQQFPTIFTLDGTNVRRTTEAEVEAIKAREAEAAAKREAAEAERKRKAEEKQREALLRVVKDRKSVRERAINVIVASTSGLKLEAVRRAITTVLTSTRARTYSRIVVCGSQECPSEVNEQPFGNEETLRGAYNRLSHAVKHRILLPAMPKAIPRGNDDLFDNEALYQVILPENFAQTLKNEAEAAKKAKAVKAEAKVEAEAKPEGEANNGDTAMKDEGEETKEDELLPGEERELIVADYYVAVENGVVAVEIPPVSLSLPTFPVPEKAAPASTESATEGEKAETVEGEQPAKIQKTETSRIGQPEQCKFFMNGSCKFGAACRLAHPEPSDEELPEFTAEDKQNDGTVYVDMAWVIIYNARTGLTVRIPSTGNTIPSRFVDAARESGFAKTCGSLISDQLSAELDMKINPVDPHKVLNAGVISRGHLLEQALTVGFAQLTHKEMARKRVVAVARAKEQAAQRAAALEKEQARKREEAEEKARQEKAAEEKAAADASAAAAMETSAPAASESAPASESTPTSEGVGQTTEPVVVHTEKSEEAPEAVAE